MTCKFCVSSLLQRNELLNLVEPNNKVLKKRAQSNHHLIHEKRNNATHYKNHKCNNKVVGFKDRVLVANLDVSTLELNSLKPLTREDDSMIEFLK
jgi:hypothetical protein